jgi:hypothetical protein
MKYLSLIIALLWAAAVQGQLSVLPIDKTATPAIQDNGQEPSEKGIFIVPPARYIGGNRSYYTVTQHVIDTFANKDAPSQGGGSFPAGALLGYGPTSVIRGNSGTQALAAGIRSVIITEDYAAAPGPGFRQRTVAGFEPAVLKPTIKDITVMGYDINSDDYNSEGVVDSQP